MKFLKLWFPVFSLVLLTVETDAQFKNNYSNFNTVYGIANYSDSVKNINLNDQPPKWHEFLTRIPGDFSDYLNITFKSNKISLYLGTAVVTGILIATDDWSYTESDRWYKSSNVVKSASDFFVEMGDGKTQFGLAASYALYGLLWKDNKALRTGSQIAQAVLASGTVVQILKHITGRESPFVRTSPTGIWRFFPNQIDYHKRVPHYDAFPSGHLTTSIATVVVIAENYPETKWIKPLGYLLSAGVAIGMANTGIHWYSDYPLAIVLGYSFGMLAAHPEGLGDILGNESGKKGFSVSPDIQASGMGLSLKYNF